MTYEPMVPPIKKATPPRVIAERFASAADLLKRFTVAKSMASAWDGERDGLREAVKGLEEGRHGDMMLLFKKTTAVCYPNAEGKHQLEDMLQVSVPREALSPGSPVVALAWDGGPEALLDRLLAEMQHGKASALAMLEAVFAGTGTVLDNCTMYSKEEGVKSEVYPLMGGEDDDQ
jgi:hypothetical protein